MKINNSWRSILLSVMVACISLLIITHLEATEKNTSLPRVTILQIVEHEALNTTRRGIEDELATMGILFEYESAQGNPALASQIAQKFAGSIPAVMIGIGTTATQALISSNRKQKIPIIFSSVTDPIGSHIVSNLNIPGSNVTGVSNYINPSQQFKVFKQILPKMTRLGVIYNPGEANSVSIIETMSKEITPFGIQIITSGAHTSAEISEATLSLINKVDALFINNDNTALSAFDAITKIAAQHSIPVFVSDTAMLSKGALAALGPNQYDIGRQTGKMVIEVLKGKTPGSLAVVFPEKVELHLNLKAAEKLEIQFSEELRKTATVINGR